MAAIPETSTTLLRDLAGDSQHARWGEFVSRYRPMMEAFMREKFPGLDADDVIQETLAALVKALPSYRYVPEEKGSFHNYLTGILRHKALKTAASEARRNEVLEGFASDPARGPEAKGTHGKGWRESVFEIALQQLLASGSIHERTKQVFVRIAVNGEPPAEVAASLGIDRNAVDQIKNRMMLRLRRLVKALGKVDGS